MLSNFQSPKRRFTRASFVWLFWPFQLWFLHCQDVRLPVGITRKLNNERHPKHESPNLPLVILPAHVHVRRLGLLKPQKRSEVTAWPFGARPATPSFRPSQAAPPVVTSRIFTAVPSFRGKIAGETGSAEGKLWQCYLPLWEIVFIFRITGWITYNVSTYKIQLVVEWIFQRPNTPNFYRFPQV